MPQGESEWENEARAIEDTATKETVLENQRKKQESRQAEKENKMALSTASASSAKHTVEGTKVAKSRKAKTDAKAAKPPKAEIYSDIVDEDESAFDTTEIKDAAIASAPYVLGGLFLAGIVGAFFIFRR